MPEAELATRVADVLSVDADEFRRRAEEDAEVIKDAVEDGVFDNPQAIVGLEYEFYAVKDDDCALRRVPRRLLELIGFEKELGLHNAEMTTSPQPLNADGILAQESEVKARLRTALDVTQSERMRLVSDALWTLPPEGEDAGTYLTDSVERTVGDTERTIRIATNMSDSARYHAMANTDQASAAGMCIEAPNVSLQGDTVMPESLITSIQPHYQVAHAIDLPTYFNYALRVAGPLLALGVNSPFFPADLYDDDATPEAILEDGWMEHRISVFETVLNDPSTGEGKVRFPRDLGSVDEAIDRVATDDTMVPMPVEAGERFDDEFPHFRRKHGTYWRWVRPVFGGPTRSAANARIEFRPIPAQPTVRDSVSFLAAFAGLLESLVRLEHPVHELDWQVARENFYAAMREGLEADLTWITNDGKETTDPLDLYEDLLAHAEDGLTNRGLSEEQAAKYLYPLRRRVRQRMTPARWKRAQVRSALEDGADLPDAVGRMQRRYVERQSETLLDGSFADWIVENDREWDRE
ncbi:hypothetical protein SAMN05444422_107209 [Halobiforma haloterrestris]|uniref:Gamma-glutamyl:cysteine ligase YbdK, ATP-grasp superfamily n=1 Tax=Natronobacterium haloterrestre TaxID=148448 RepID=A0A1I1IRK9_NATHA|nr:hypothetical protein [Halobiforma haloterrestris]SFC36383.1 hypothetical protein SAMN05444422_107209 [Halobiforma haloterrestris]